MSYKIKSKIQKRKGGSRKGEDNSENIKPAKSRLLCHVIEPEEVEVVYVS